MSANKNKIGALCWVDENCKDERLTRDDKDYIATLMLSAEDCIDGNVGDKAAAIGAQAIAQKLLTKRTPPKSVDQHKVVADYVRQNLAYLGIEESAVDDVASRLLRQAEPAFNSAGELRPHILILGAYELSERPDAKHLFAGKEPKEPTQRERDEARVAQEQLAFGMTAHELATLPPEEKMRRVREYEHDEQNKAKGVEAGNLEAQVIAEMDRRHPGWKYLQQTGNIQEYMRMYRGIEAEIKAKSKKAVPSSSYGMTADELAIAGAKDSGIGGLPPEEKLRRIREFERRGQ